MNIQVLHCDEHILVVNKPAGLPVLTNGWEPEAPYLVKMLEEQYRDPSTGFSPSGMIRQRFDKLNAAAQLDGSGRIWVVHRLDKITSGVMVFARTAEAHRELNRQFERHEVEKVYQAVVEGVPPWDEHTAMHMLRTNVGRRHRTVVVHKRGKKSETYFEVLKRGQVGALLEVRPKTGRTHQIRVHLSALGFPILGDVLYGAQETDLIGRPALHALSLTFAHPITGERVPYSAPFPSDIQQLIERIAV